MRLDTPNTTQLTQNVYFQLNFRFTFSHYKNDNYMEKKQQRKKEERKIYVEEQQQQPVQSETHNWRVLCMRETKKAIWHILFHSLFVIITFIMRFFFIRRPPQHNHQCPLIHLQQSAFCLRQSRRGEGENNKQHTKIISIIMKRRTAANKKKLTKMKEKVGLATD